MITMLSNRPHTRQPNRMKSLFHFCFMRYQTCELNRVTKAIV